MRQETIEPDFEAWRTAARTLLLERVAPEDVEILDCTTPHTLGLDFGRAAATLSNSTAREIYVPRAFVELAQVVARHASPERWQLLYRLLWRLQRDQTLLYQHGDRDVAASRRMDQQVRRDVQRLQARVRFRQLIDDAGQERSIAWYRPEHDVLGLAVHHFVERFPGLRWSILTPQHSAHWEPATRRLTWTEGSPRPIAPLDNELVALWLKSSRTLSQKHKDEYLPRLAASQVDTGETMTIKSAELYLPASRGLQELAAALPACRGCELYCHATQAVFGAGQARAELMLVGEQPGDEEDRKGRPFVGPAGRVLNRVIEELGLHRDTMYVTNAVKHFKFIERGKRRLHQAPRLSEVTACRPWLLAELQAVKPKVVICLGATASKSLLGNRFALMKDRGKLVASPYAEHVVATIHPSAVLRAMDPQGGEQLYDFLRQDLLFAHQTALKMR